MRAQRGRFIAWAGLLAATAGPAAPARADAPKVVEARPDDGAEDVDPATKEIRVAFDQPMDRGGMSITGGGPTFPQIVGKPRWVDDRTIAMEVRLKPSWTYAMGFNSPSFRNFRSKAGEPAVPYPITFKTGPGKVAQATGPEENRRAVEVLRAAIDEDYSYRDLRKVDWPAAFRAATPGMAAAATPEEFATRAAKMLAAAKDLHLWLQVGEAVTPTGTRRVTPNINRDRLAKLVPGWSETGPGVFAGKFPDGIAYILIPTWGGDDRTLDAALAALRRAAASGAKAIVVDVRPNAGGAEPRAQAFAGCFLDGPKPYAKNANRRGGAFAPPNTRVVAPNPAGPKFRGRVAVLMGPANMSSCESFLLMMKQVPGCVTVGARSYGSSGNPKPVDLGNGVVAFLPSWKDLRPDGTCFEGEGLAPDVEIKAGAADLATKDPVLDAALAILRK